MSYFFFNNFNNANSVFFLVRFISTLTEKISGTLNEMKIRDKKVNKKKSSREGEFRLYCCTPIIVYQHNEIFNWKWEDSCNCQLRNGTFSLSLIANDVKKAPGETQNSRDFLFCFHFQTSFQVLFETFLCFTFCVSVECLS